MGEGCGIRGVGVRLGVAHVLGAQEAGDGLGLGGADLGGGDVVSEQQQRPGVGQIQRALEVRVDRIEQAAQAADPAGLVDDQVGTPADEQAQFGDGVLLQKHGPEVGRAQAELVGDDARVLWVTLGQAADAALAGAVDGQAGDVDEALAGVDQHGADQGGDAAEQVDADQALAAECSEFGDELADVLGGVVDLSAEPDVSVLGDRGGPMDLLGRVDADADLHVTSWFWSPPMQRPLPAGNALNSDGSRRVISGRAKVARRAAVQAHRPGPPCQASLPCLP